ncbi:MAG: hypothetical protein HDR13_10180 [Lachnospiraceae bacterium]|nr:hypothetical protein [Lachnospiraceae bacterium]
MKVKYSNIIMWLLIISPIIDNINGYLLLTENNTSISAIYKTITFFICVFILIKIIPTRKEIGRKILVLFFFTIQIGIFGLNDIGGCIYNVSALIKLLMPMIIIMTMIKLNYYDNTIVRCVEKICNSYCWFFPVSLIVPMLFDIGFDTYRSGFGNKGFYYAGNEISAIMVIILTMEIEKYKTDKTKLNFINIILGVAGTICIGTKASYIALAILLLVGLSSEQNINKKLLSICLLIPSVFGGLWYITNHVNSIVQNINAIRWRYLMASGIVNFLLSGREVTARRVFRQVYDEDVLWKLILGIGPYVAENGADHILIEMDLFDLLVQFGGIVTVIVILFYAQYLKKALYSKKTIYIVGIILLYGISVFSGHVILAPMVGVVLAVLLLKIEFNEK